MEREKNHEIVPTKEFVKKNWPYAVIIGGTIAGAAIWITARYLKERKPKSSEAYIDLTQIEKEVEASKDKTAVVLETGSHLSRVAGEDLDPAARDLKEHIKDMTAGEILDILRELGRLEANRRERAKRTKKT